MQFLNNKFRAMCSLNKSSLEVSYIHLAEMQSLLAMWLNDVPRELLTIFDEVLKQIVLEDFPNYSKVSSKNFFGNCFIY
jgi:DNA replication licensing factor MCM2